MKSKEVKTATFRLGKYHIDQIGEPLEGMCDVPNGHNRLRMMIPDGQDLPSLSTIIHEAMHAEGIPDRYLDGEFADASQRIAKFLWRLGWRRTAG